MPKDSFKTEIIKAIQSGITKHPESSEFEEEDQFTNMCTLLLLFLYGYLSGHKEHSTEDHGRNLIGFLQSQQAFKANYLVSNTLNSWYLELHCTLVLKLLYCFTFDLVANPTYFLEF